jgi:hypothetical protein
VSARDCQYCRSAWALLGQDQGHGSAWRCGLCGKSTPCRAEGVWLDSETTANVPGGGMLLLDPVHRRTPICSRECMRRFIEGGGLHVHDVEEVQRETAALLTKSAAKSAELAGITYGEPARIKAAAA